MIEVKNLSKDYGDRRAIDSLNFHVGKGEVVGFLGPNGAGKSTTMKIITGFMAPTSGEVRVAGLDIFEDPIGVKQRLGYLPEVPPVYPDMMVEDYLIYVAHLRKTPRAFVKKNVARAIEKTNLGEVRRRIIGHLSKGFKQRVGIAQALVSDPDILILDEPTSGLDPRQVAEVRELIRELRGHHTIILSTHILSEVQANCERIIIINRGKIVAEDSLEGLTTRMTGKRRVTVKVRRSVEVLARSLKSLAGVEAVEMANTLLQIDTLPDDNVIEQIAAHCVGQGAGLLELRTNTMGLEDIFIKLTGDAEVKLEASL